MLTGQNGRRHKDAAIGVEKQPLFYFLILLPEIASYFQVSLWPRKTQIKPKPTGNRNSPKKGQRMKGVEKSL